MRLVITALGGTLFCAFVNSVSIGSTPCTSPTECVGDTYATHCIKCLGRNGANDLGYCSYIDPAWQSNPCSNHGYSQFCSGLCSEAMVSEQPFVFKGTATAEVPSGGTSSDEQTGSDSQQPVTVPTVPSSDSNQPSSVQQPSSESDTSPNTNSNDKTGSDSTVPTVPGPGPQQPVIVPTVPDSDSSPPSSGQQPSSDPATAPNTKSNDKSGSDSNDKPSSEEQPSSDPDTSGDDNTGDKWRRPHRKHRRPEEMPSSQQTTPETPTQEPQNIEVPPAVDGATDKSSKSKDQPDTVPSAGQIHEYKAPPLQIWRTKPTFDPNPPGTNQPQANPAADGDQSDTSGVSTTPETDQPTKEKPRLTGPVGVASADIDPSSDDKQSNSVAFASDAEAPGDWSQLTTS